MSVISKEEALEYLIALRDNNVGEWDGMLKDVYNFINQSQQMDISKEQIQNIYKEKGYTTTQVANILNISRRSMYNFLDGKMSQEKRHNYIKLIVHLKPLYNEDYINQPVLDSDVEEAINRVQSTIDLGLSGFRISPQVLNTQFIQLKTTIKQVLIDKDMEYIQLGHEFEELQSKLTAIEEVVKEMEEGEPNTFTPKHIYIKKINQILKDDKNET